MPKSRYTKPRRVPQERWDRLNEQQRMLLVFFHRHPVPGKPAVA